MAEAAAAGTVPQRHPLPLYARSLNARIVVDKVLPLLLKVVPTTGTPPGRKPI